MKIPQHVAIILDGNGRWAKSKGMPRNYGHIQGAKTVEGTLAMGMTSFLCVTVTLVLMAGVLWWKAILIALVVAVVSALTELFTKKGWDTVTVPVMALIVLLLFRI